MSNRNLICVAFAILLVSCDKNSSPTKSPDNNNCDASIAGVENITIFPNDNPWNINISTAEVDPYSNEIIQGMGDAALKADFGSGLWEGAPIGIPFVVVCGDQSKSTVTFRGNDYDNSYGDESDPGPYAIPLNATIEGAGQGDSHVIAVDQENGALYELYNASVNGDHWEASSGAIFDLTKNEYRPEGWTSADAAGLPIFPGLVRYEEVLKGEIDHAIRFTLNKSFVKPDYIFPASHKVNSTGGTYSLPFGAKIRLKQNFDVSGYSATNKVILNAMKNYGLILSDIGSNLYISGAPDERWNNDDLHELGNVGVENFEVVKFN
jgi:hypothetical protein